MDALAPVASVVPLPSKSHAYVSVSPLASVATAAAFTAKGAKPGFGDDTASSVEPLQWWGDMSQRFQEIAASAMKDVAQKTAVDTAKNMAGGAVKEAVKAAKKTGARKSAPRERSPKT